MSKSASFTCIFLGALIGCDAPVLAQVQTPKVTATQKQDITPSAQELEFTGSFLDFIHLRSTDPKFDSRALFNHSADKLKLQVGAERESHIAKRKTMFDEYGIVHSFRDFVSAGGTVTFLRFRRREGALVALFRAVPKQGGVLYFECKLSEKSQDGTVRAVDIYQFADSEWLSDSDVAAHIKAKAARNPLELQALFPGVKLTESDALECYQLMKCDLIEDWKGVLSKFATLSSPLQRNREILLMRFKASARLKRQAEMDWTLDRLIEFHGDTPIVASMSIDLHAKRGELAKALAAINKVERVMEGDPYLDFVRATLSLTAGKPESAMTYATSAIEREPSLTQVHWIIARAGAKLHESSKVEAALRQLVEAKLTTLTEIENHSDFATFVASPEFKAWKAESEGKK